MGIPSAHHICCLKRIHRVPGTDRRTKHGPDSRDSQDSRGETRGPKGESQGSVHRRLNCSQTEFPEKGGTTDLDNPLTARSEGAEPRADPRGTERTIFSLVYVLLLPWEFSVAGKC